MCGCNTQACQLKQEEKTVTVTKCSVEDEEMEVKGEAKENQKEASHWATLDV